VPRVLTQPQRILTLWLPRWPVQRRLLAEPALRQVPVFVCRRQPRGVMTVAAWAWALPPRVSPGEGAARAAAGCVINVGMSLAEAMAVLAMAHGPRACHLAWIDHDDPVADRAALLELARWCRRFTPAVAVEGAAGDEGQQPECLHLDVTATAGFFAGEERLVRTAVWTLAVRGIHARGAIADTPGAAWAAAHHTDLLAGMSGSPAARGRRRRSVVVAPGGHLLPAERASGKASADKPDKPDKPGKACQAPPHLVDALPVASLRLDSATLQKLGEVGVDSIGGVMRLPRRSLASRFGPRLVRRLAEFTGERSEPLEPQRGGELPQASHSFDFPVSLRSMSEEQFAGLIRPLLEGCVRPLSAAGQGVTALQVRLGRSAGAGGAAGPTDRPRAPNPPIVIDVGLYRPSVSVAHLGELIRLRMSRTPLPGEIDGVSIEVVAAGDVASRQQMLFGDTDDVGQSQVTMLLERLSGRLGRGAVYAPRAVADAQPEHAWMAVPPGLAQAAGRAGAAAGKGAWREQRREGTVAARLPAPQRRPIWLLPRPVRLDPLREDQPQAGAAGQACRSAGQVVPGRFRFDALVYRVVSAQGPERIETAWWRGPCVRRDYFLVECVAGDGNDGMGRFWIFRRRRDDVWFLHGIFA
jgi:protein ImuB